MDKALKQRLVGAVVLIALAVVVLPMMLGGRPSPGEPEARTIELPAPPPDLDFETRRFPVGSEPGTTSGREPGRSDETTANGESGRIARPLPEPDLPSVEVASEEDELQPDPGPDRIPDAEVAQAAQESSPDEPESGEPVTDEPAPGEQAADSMETLVAGLLASESESPDLRYVVQVASFGSSDNAVRLARQLEQAGYAVLLDRVSSETGELDRVRVGPYASEEEAQAATAALRENISGVNPRIVDMQPDQAAPTLAGEDPLLRWVVQVGSFSSRENAAQLVSRLMASGLSAYEETVQNDSSTIYRVRVGPFLDRTTALEAERKIAADMGIDGVVMSAD